MRKISYDDTLPNDPFDLSGSVTGWGISLSSNLKATKDDTLRLQYVYGHGIQNYFNDAPVDVAIKSNPGNAVTPIRGEALPVTGPRALRRSQLERQVQQLGRLLARQHHQQRPRAASAYQPGQYFVGNLLTTPVKNVMVGGEFQWAHRENNSDGFKVDDVRLQFSFKYSFSYKLGG